MTRFVRYPFLITIFLTLLPNFAFGQSVVDSIDSNSGSVVVPNLATERIRKISPTKRIFVITNENSSFDKGDFISIIFNGRIVARALAAKSKDSLAGIKILRIHSLALWNVMKAGLDVQIVRGDDSYFKTPAQGGPDGEEEDGPKITSDDDLFNETVIDDTISFEENKNRAIKTDNVVTVAYSRYSGVDNTGGGTTYSMFNGAWMYQLEDNIWIEGLFGRNVINGFPADDIDTTVTNLTARVKYTISAPFYSYIMPYVGYQRLSLDSPDAGQQNDQGTKQDSELQSELDRLADMEKSTFVFGVTILKRLVPGWFVKADLGSDVIGVGFGLEF